MQRIDGRLVLSPTDLTKHVLPPHHDPRPAGSRQLCRGARREGRRRRAQPRLRQGLAHEADYLQALRDRGLSIIEIEGFGTNREAAESATVEAMHEGVDVVYQATLFDGQWVGHADFLLRTDRPSDLGDWSYDIADTKLARRLKVPALLQMATYAARLATLQGVAPRRLVVVTGDKEESLAAGRRGAVPAAAGRWCCTPSRPAPPRSPRPVRSARSAAGRLAVSRSGSTPMTSSRSPDCAATSGRRCAPTGSPPWQSSPLRRSSRSRRCCPQPPRPACTSRPGCRWPSARAATRHAPSCHQRRAAGCSGSREPSPGDVYLDFEGDPWADDGRGREYLAGLWDRTGTFTGFWAHDSAGEAAHRGPPRRADAPLACRPGHAHLPLRRLRADCPCRLTGRHGTREAEFDQLLRGERLVDLYAVVRQGIRISKPSYSIKKVEDFYWGHTHRRRGRRLRCDDIGGGVRALAHRARRRDPRVDPPVQRGRRALHPRPPRLAGAARRELAEQGYEPAGRSRRRCDRSVMRSAPRPTWQSACSRRP